MQAGPSAAVIPNMSATIFYTLEEIKKNNGKDGSRIWIVYKDGVFDVTDYVENVSLYYCCWLFSEQKLCRDKK